MPHETGSLKKWQALPFLLLLYLSRIHLFYLNLIQVCTFIAVISPSNIGKYSYVHLDGTSAASTACFISVDYRVLFSWTSEAFWPVLSAFYSFHVQFLLNLQKNFKFTSVSFLRVENNRFLVGPLVFLAT